ncbi:MAG: hypothetical protein QM802_14440 [Agriterribacter sp.]
MHSDWSLFFGRFHPLFVHIPIGIILFAAILNVIAHYKKSATLNTAVNIALLCGAIGAALAALSGYLLSLAGGYNEQTLFWHKWIGIIAAVLTFAAWFIKTRSNKDISIVKMKLSTWVLSICIILIAAGGHLGGNMTHGEGYLTAYMPGFLKTIFASKVIAPQKKTTSILDSVNVFTDIIQPVFNAKCVSCHNPDKLKGELDMSTIPGCIKGGKSGNTIVAGDLEKSELFRRITLPRESSKFMPADNHKPLTPIEISFVQWWIQSGAEYKKNIKALGVDEKTKYLVAAYMGIGTEQDKEIILPQVAAADANTLQQLKDLKVMLQPLTSKSNLLEVSLVMVQKADAAKLSQILQKLSSVKEQVYQLDASNCNLNKDALNIIGTFSRLHKLEIQKNNLTDEAVESLTGLQQLEILNINQNNITDKSISVFKKMPALKKLNLWQTQVTEQGTKELAGLLVER